MYLLTDNALKVLKARYLLRNRKGKIIETPEQMFRRVAHKVGSGEKKFTSGGDPDKWEKKFYEVMTKLLFLPNTPTLMNAGTSANQLSACFVLPVKDTDEEIVRTLDQTIRIQKSGGGTGFNFSDIPPEEDAFEYNITQEAGPVSVMKAFDSVTEEVRQGGKRRGANMGILSITHPDIEKFIASKKREGILSNFNISVLVTDSFMKAVENNKSWNLIHPSTGTVTGKVNARKLWKKIVEMAHQTGDPGIIFLDAINKKNPTPALGKIECTNPCGEVPLLDYESCNLGSINLSRMIKNRKINWKLLEETITTSVRFLDNIIEINDYVLPEIESITKGNRKIGLGIMGWADTLIQLRIPYASEKAIRLGERVMKFIRDKSFFASQKLAQERGVFPNWESSIYYPDKPVRNATRTSIAPTGTISIIAGASPSIEPIFAIDFTRKHILENKTMTEKNSLFRELMGKERKLTPEQWKRIQMTGSIQNIRGISPDIKKIFLTAHEINYLFHLRHQLAFQKYTDNAVSKTINFPEKIKKSEVEKAFLYAWKNKAKGITVFREGSKKSQVMNKGNMRKGKMKKESSSCRICMAGLSNKD